MLFTVNTATAISHHRLDRMFESMILLHTPKRLTHTDELVRCLGDTPLIGSEYDGLRW